MSDITDTSYQETYLLTRVGGESLVFPSKWVNDILLIERSQLLRLPFYDPQVFGIIHHQGKIVPLIWASRALAIKQEHSPLMGKKMLMAIRLNQSMKNLADVGVIVDQVLQNINFYEINDEKIFHLSDIPQHIWQPQRWN